MKDDPLTRRSGIKPISIFGVCKTINEIIKSKEFIDVKNRVRLRDEIFEAIGCPVKDVVYEPTTGIYHKVWDCD